MICMNKILISFVFAITLIKLKSNIDTNKYKSANPINFEMKTVHSKNNCA